MNQRENVGILSVLAPNRTWNGGAQCSPLCDARSHVLRKDWERIHFARTEPFCMAMSWAWLSHGTAAKCSRASVYRPCDCGHSSREHTLDAGCIDSCPCHRWQHTPAWHTDLSVNASCSDVCTCGGEHAEGAVYFVSAVRGQTDNTGTRPAGVAFLLGPYASHSYALSMVETGRALAHKANPYQAMGIAVGTVAWNGAEPPTGVLNNSLAAEEARRESKRSENENPGRRSRRSVAV